jgi:hypothetical protein
MKTMPSKTLLKENHRWDNYAWPLFIVALGLGATLAEAWRRHFSVAKVEAWGDLPVWWAGGVLFTGGAALLVWFLCRKQMLASARKLDAQLAARNRIETAIALQADSSPIARAQREETAEFLQPLLPKRRPLWILIVAAVVVFVVHVATLLTWTRPWEASVPSSVPEEKPPKVPQASIQWKSPKSETRAAAVEEVPLEALADSTSGLQNLVLQVAVNGEPRSSTPIQADELAKPGKHGINASLYLDQLDVEPYDIVSYYLTAQRIDPRKLPETTSPVQFVQVQPFRDDVREINSGGEMVSYPLVLAIKAAQLRLLKENFVLTHTDVARDSAEWQQENVRVSEDQGLLEKKTAEVIQTMILQGEPAEIVNLLSQAQELMGKAVQNLSAMENAEALVPQGKALGLITAVEKYVAKVKAKSKAKAKYNVSDPFADNKVLELKQRFKTEAGELELLAKEQALIVDDIAKDPAASAEQKAEENVEPDPSRINGTLAERQAQISQRLGALLNGKVFQPKVVQHLERGREFGGESLKHLDAEDAAAAREPAGAALREINLALKIMNRDGEEEAQMELINALQALNKAADLARTLPQQPSEEAAKARAEEVQGEAKKAAQRLAEAAQKQQQNGSEKAAKRLNALARRIASEEVQKTLDELLEQPKAETVANAAADRLQNLADLAAMPSNGEMLSPEELEELVKQLERAKANLERLAKAEGESRQGEKQGDNDADDKNPREGSSEPESGEKAGGRQGQSGSPGSGSSASKEEWNNQADFSPGRAGSSSQPAARDQFARDLMEEIREGMQQAQNVLKNKTALESVRDLINQKSEIKQVGGGNVAGLYLAIDPPLGEVIRLLREELNRAKRDHQLSEQSADTAPAAYRSAVADYFERLSRDYENGEQ